MMSSREILIKKNLLRKSFVEKKINDREYAIALRKLEEQEKMRNEIDVEKKTNLGLFRKRLMGN